MFVVGRNKDDIVNLELDFSGYPIYYYGSIDGAKHLKPLKKLILSLKV